MHRVSSPVIIKFMRACICVRVYVCVYIIYTYIHYTHTYIHTYIHTMYVCVYVNMHMTSKFCYLSLFICFRSERYVHSIHIYSYVLRLLPVAQWDRCFSIRDISLFLHTKAIKHCCSKVKQNPRSDTVSSPQAKFPPNSCQIRATEQCATEGIKKASFSFGAKLQ